MKKKKIEKGKKEKESGIKKEVNKVLKNKDVE